MPMPLSVLDLVPLGRGISSRDSLAASTELARAVERCGYARLWYAEHHNMPGIATTTPEILIAHVANHTSRIRLGAGGVMLPNHSPLKVAESYRLLEALHPGRIDLGIGRAPGTDPLTAVALRRSRAALETDDFLDQFAELMAYDAGTFPPTHPFRNIRAMPDDVRLPPIWLLGSGDYSAQLAAELGLGFAFAGHFSPEPAEGPMRLYRSLFEERRPRDSGLRAPHAILALAVYCADTEAEAKRMASSIRVAFAQLRTGKPDRLPSPDEALARELTPPEEAAVAFFDRIGIVGAPEQVKARIDEIVARTGADEVMIATHAYDSAARIRSHELVAQLYAQPM